MAAVSVKKSVDSCYTRASADHHYLTVSRAQVSAHWVRDFLKLSADKLLLFESLQAQVQFFLMHGKYENVFMSRTIKLLISNWPRTRELSQLLQTGKLLLTFLTMVTRWSRSTSSFYALIGQNLTGEFMR